LRPPWPALPAGKMINNELQHNSESFDELKNSTNSGSASEKQYKGINDDFDLIGLEGQSLWLGIKSKHEMISWEDWAKMTNNFEPSYSALFYKATSQIHKLSIFTYNLTKKTWLQQAWFELT
jgi:hypothetical protein